MTKLLIGIPTLARADLLVRNRTFLEGIRLPDEVLIIDNGQQKIDLKVPIVRSPQNFGVSGSWNFLLRYAFVYRDFDALVLLQDDIIWQAGHLDWTRRLLLDRPDIHLFLSYMQFSVQVHRPENFFEVGGYDERFHPAYCEDDDYALALHRAGRVYERFHELDPLPGSQIEGTRKPVPWAEQNAKLVAKWGRSFGVNLVDAPWYRTNRGLDL